MPDRRLCGPLDGRRRRQRCEGCQRNHLKCGSARPCSPCTQRGTECISPRPATQNLQLVSLNRGPRRIPQSLQSNRAEQYGLVFFAAVGEDPALLRMFSVSSLTSVLHDDAMVKEAVSVIGGLYALQNPHLIEMSRQDKHHLFEQLHDLRETVAGKVSNPARNRASFATLTTAVLLSFADILVDPVGKQWDILVRQLYIFSKSSLNGLSAESREQLSLATLVRILNALRAVVLEQDLDIGVPQQSLPSVHISLLPKDTLLVLFASDVETWAHIQQWTRAWETGDSHDPVTIPTGVHTREYRGLELTCIASQFQRDIISRLNWYTTQARDTFVSFMLSLYHCISVDISRMFTAPAWLRLGCELPIMPHRLSYEQATSALQFAERSISSLHLEAIFYSPMLYVLGMEMVRKADRRRMVDFIGKVRHRGFSVIDQFLFAIERDWASAG